MTSQPTELLQMVQRAEAFREHMQAVKALITPAVVERMSALAERDPGLTPMQLVTEALDPDGPPSVLLDSHEAAGFALRVALSIRSTGSLLDALLREIEREIEREVSR